MTKRSRKERAERSGRYPLGTIAYYGPDDARATKLVAAVIGGPGHAPSAMRRWTCADSDVREDPVIGLEVATFLLKQGALKVMTAERIMGCPHEEGIDYPMGRACPQCPFWANRDRFTGEVISPPPPSLAVTEILRVLSTDEEGRRVEALASADSNRDELVEPLVAAIDRVVGDPVNASDDDVVLFSYALYLLAKWREPRAYQSVVSWLSLPPEQPSEIGGDIVTEDGERILAAVCDGDLGPLCGLIIDRNADEYGRGTGVGAMALLAAWAELPRQPIVDYFRWLAHEGLEREPSQVWNSLVLACVDIEAIDVFPDLRRAYQEGLPDPQFIAVEELDKVEREARGLRLNRTREEAAPISDVDEATHWWNRNPGSDEVDDGEEHFDLMPDDLEEVPQPYVAPPKVGRNDPCPCGSGLKYKKCHGK